MTTVEHLTHIDPRYPSRLRGFDKAPASLSTRGGPLEADRVVAIVGARRCSKEARDFATTLAGEVAAAGAVVASGGAFGIDHAAHRGALSAGGRTWVVAGTGCLDCFPTQHRALYEEVAAGPGAMIWPFDPTQRARTYTFPARNWVLVALADAVVVVQAGARSGALHTAGCAIRLEKPLWVVPVAPWSTTGYEGSLALLESGRTRPLASPKALLRSLRLGAPGARRAPRPTLPRTLSVEEFAIFGATSSTASHLDEIAARANASAQTASAALLTLALENVVVEGPPGFFRRRDGF